MNETICVICLEPQGLIEYNHCGKYYIHDKCLNKWNVNDCFICREKIISDTCEIVEYPVSQVDENETPQNCAIFKLLRKLIYYLFK